MNNSFFFNFSNSDCETNLLNVVSNCSAFNVWLQFSMSIGLTISLCYLILEISRILNYYIRFIKVWELIEKLLFILCIVEIILCTAIIISF